jgi:hypothetical protein
LDAPACLNGAIIHIRLHFQCLSRRSYPPIQ